MTITLKPRPNDHNTLTLFATVNQMFRRLLPASDYCRAGGNQVIEHSSDNETVPGSSRKRGGAADYLIDGGEKRVFVEF